MRVLFAFVVITPAAVAVVYLIGSLILSGGKVSASMDTKWDVIRPYPLFVVPTTALAVLGVIAILLALGVAASTRAADAERVQRLVGPALASAVCCFGLSLVAPDAGTRLGDTVIGGQWIGSILNLVALAIIVIALVAARGKHPLHEKEHTGR